MAVQQKISLEKNQALVGSTLATIAVTAFLMSRLGRGGGDA